MARAIKIGSAVAVRDSNRATSAMGWFTTNSAVNDAPTSMFVLVALPTTTRPVRLVLYIVFTTTSLFGWLMGARLVVEMSSVMSAPRVTSHMVPL